MYIRIPFNVHACLDTTISACLTKGPTAAEMNRVQEEYEGGLLTDIENLAFVSPGNVWTLGELLDIREDRLLVDTWWLWGLLDDIMSTEVYILWSPDNSRSSYLTTCFETIDTFGWGGE